MNRLSREKRARIVELEAEGKSLREIASIVGCSRETVLALSRGAFQRKILAAVEKVFDELACEHGVEPCNVDALMELFGLVCIQCPIHPEAEPGDDVDNGYCLLCKSDAQKRMHERRAEQGLPKLLPPWRQK